MALEKNNSKIICKENGFEYFYNFFFNLERTLPDFAENLPEIFRREVRKMHIRMFVVQLFSPPSTLLALKNDLASIKNG